MKHPSFIGAFRTVSLALVFTGAASASATAQDPPRPSPTPVPSEVPTTTAPATPDDGDDAELQNLLKIVAQETAVATRTRINGDFVPGIVTVLRADELLSLGVRTVWDALAFVPGVQATRGVDGLPGLIVRGLDFPFSSGNMKILVDSTPVVRDNAGIDSSAFDFPIALVERIEVIRGPGSVVYGDFAYMGLVNVITRKSGARVSTRLNEGAGATLAFAGGTTTRRGLEVSVALAGFEAGVGEAPLNLALNESRVFGTASARFGGFSLTANTTRRDGDASESTASDGSQRHWTLEGRFRRDVSERFRVEARVSRRDNDYVTASASLRGTVTEAGVEGQWTGHRQSWLFDASLSSGYIDRGAATPPAPPPPPPGAPPPPPPPAGLEIRDERVLVASLMAQNSVELSEQLALTLGARFDRHGDVDSRVTPRASLVWRVSERNILKAQYAEGFRAPNFFELYSLGSRATNLDFEVNGTLELNAVHRRPSTVLRFTGYRTSLRDMVYVERVNAQARTVFANNRKARVIGAEFEMERQFGAKVRALANASFFDTRDSRNTANRFVENPLTPAAVVNVALMTAPLTHTQASIRFRSVGRRPVTGLAAYQEYEATLGQRRIGGTEFSAIAGVRVSPGRGVTFGNVLPSRTTIVAYRLPRFFFEISWSR